MPDPESAKSAVRGVFAGSVRAAYAAFDLMFPPIVEVDRLRAGNWLIGVDVDRHTVPRGVDDQISLAGVEQTIAQCLPPPVAPPAREAQARRPGGPLCVATRNDVRALSASPAGRLSRQF
jgi:hypothetical protein